MWDGGFLSPLEHDVSTVFGTKRIMNGTWTSIHRGMDIRGKEGDDVMASNNGKVVLAEELFFGGNTIILDHGQGIYTIYMHLSKFNVNAGRYCLKRRCYRSCGFNRKGNRPPSPLRRKGGRDQCKPGFIDKAEALRACRKWTARNHLLTGNAQFCITR